MNVPPGRRWARADGEELAGHEVERDVGLAVGIHEDRVIAGVTGLEPRSGVRGVEVQARARQVEVALADRRQRTVELDGVHARVREEVPVGARHAAGGVAEDRDPAGRRRRAGPRGERQHEEVVPVAVGEVGPGLVHRVHGHPLVELEPADAAGELDDARVLVLGLGGVDHPAVGHARADRRRRNGQRRADHRRHDPEPPQAQPRHRDQRQRQREHDERPVGADRRDEQQRGQERADQTSRRWRSRTGCRSCARSR